jgi:hypothetical protein
VSFTRSQAEIPQLIRFPDRTSSDGFKGGRRRPWTPRDRDLEQLNKERSNESRQSDSSPETAPTG